jgi:hypothetical protein
MTSVLLFGRLANPITVSPSLTVPTSGTGHQEARDASATSCTSCCWLNYPHFVPYEVPYASFYHGYGHLSVQRIGKALATLETLREEQLWDAEMRPIRNVMGRFGLKGREMDLNSINVHEIGYLLIKRPKWHTSLGEEFLRWDNQTDNVGDW